MWSATPWYDPVEVDPGVSDVLLCAWTARPTGRHRLVPDGCVDLLSVDGGPLVLCGPEHRAWHFELPAGSTAVGVRFRPGAVRAVFDLDVSSIVDRRVAIDDLVRSTRAGTPPTSCRAEVLVDWVRTARWRPVEPWIAPVVATLTEQPRANRTDLAAVAGCSLRELHRRARSSFGYGTSVLARLMRLQRFLAVADAAGGSQVTLAALAAAAGYADQAHLGRECRAIVGVTPTRLLAEHFPTFPDAADPYKTPVALAATMGV